jgi:GntR family transcriptional regulator
VTVPGGSPLAPIGQGTLTEQATKALMEAILSDSFPDNRLPAEPELALRLNISRTTVRTALQSLERLGMISRTPGRGTIVLPHVGRHSIALQRLTDFQALLQERHGHVDVKQSYWIEEEATPQVALVLAIQSQTPVVNTSKLYAADGQQAVHIADEIPLSHFSEAVQLDLRNGSKGMIDSIFALSRSLPHREIHHTVVELGTDVATAQVDFPLSLPPGQSYLALDEVHYTVHGTPVAYSKVLIDDRFLRLQVVRHL